MAKYDIVVIGGGPAGYVAAIRAAQLGFKTACIDKSETLGGTCLNVGCIPSKSLLQTTENYAFLTQKAKDHGIEGRDYSINFSQMMHKKNEVIEGLVEGVAHRFKQLNITRIKGVASFLSAQTVQVGHEVIESTYFILATGSESIELPFLRFNETTVLSSTGALSLASIPKKMLVIGAGVIGVELASVYRRLGTEVTIIEMSDRVCPTLDHSLSKALQRLLEKQGINFYLSTKVVGAEINKTGVILELEKEKLAADVVLVAIGRRPYSRDLNLKEVGIEVNSRGFISVNQAFQTTVPTIYAIGDVIDGVMLAHRASEEGVTVVEHIAGHHSKINYAAIPNVIYTHPEVASVGLSEKEAKDSGFQLLVGTCFFKANARARCLGDTEGFVKVIGDKNSGRLLGVHIIGPCASEMIGQAVMALNKKVTLHEMVQVSHAHPTFTEAFLEATLNALSRSIHY